MQDGAPPGRDLAELDLERDGACLARGLAIHRIDELETLLERQPQGEAGLRLSGCALLASWLAGHSGVLLAARAVLGDKAKPVRAVLFDKSDTVNWTLGWHQDRTIVVAERKEVANYGPWSTKQGLCQVEPPFPIIESMMTARIHLDCADAENAPLLIALGSHRLGRIPIGEIEAVVAGHPVRACLAERGDVWFYRTPILHASARVMRTGRRRRVLQVDFCAEELPAPLEWLGLER